MLREYVEQILSLYNYVDGLIVTDKNGYIEYYLSYRPDLSKVKVVKSEENIFWKYIRG